MNVWPFPMDKPTAERIVGLIGWLLVHSVWQFTCVAMVTWLLLTVFRHASAVARYRMLLTTFLLIVISPALTWIWMRPEAHVPMSAAIRPVTASHNGSDGRTISNQTAPRVSGRSEEATSREPERAVAWPRNDHLPTSAPAATRAFSPLRDQIATLVAPWLPTIVAVWSAGVLLFSIRPIWSWRNVQRLSRSGALPTPIIAHEALQRVAARLGLTRSVRIQVSSLVASPIVVGCWRSLILIPVSLVLSIPVSQLEAILAHELAHVARYDYLINLFQTLIETIFFYHPAVWWLSHRIREEREVCCDDLVVSRLGNRIEYGRALLALEEICHASRSSLAMSVKGGVLLTRVQRLLGQPVQKTSVVGVALPALLCSGMFCLSWIFLSMNSIQPSLQAEEKRAADPAAPHDAPSAALGNVPFRLPDHWIVEDIRWTEGDTQLVTATLQGGVNIRRWDLITKQLLSEIKLQSDQHGRPVEQGTVKFSPDGRRVFGVTDAYVGVWDATTGELLKQLPIPKKEWAYDTVHTLSSSHDGSILVAGLETSFSRLTLSYPTYGIVWNSVTGEVISRFEEPSGFELADIAVSADGQRFATCSRGQQVKLWETRTGNVLKDLTSIAREWKSPEPALINTNLVSGIAMTHNGHRLAIAGTYGLRLIDLATGKLLRTIDAPYGYGAADVVFSHDGRQLARTGVTRREEEPNSIVIWSVDTGEAMKAIESSASIARYSADGTYLALGESDFYEALIVCPLSRADTRITPPSPQHYERIDRVEENTHMRGESAKAFVNRWTVQWGPSQAGMQYGIALTTAGHRAANPFPIGQHVRMATFLKNTSDRPLQFGLQPDMFGNPPVIVRPDGQAIPLEYQKLVGRASLYRDQLEPGEVFGPLYLQVGLGSNPEPKRQVWTPWWSSATSGRYSATHRIQVHVANLDVQGNFNQPGWKTAELTSGPVTFEVTEAAGSPSSSQSRVNRPSDEKAMALDDKPIATQHTLQAFGRVVDGNGQAMAGVTVRVSTGIGTLRVADSAITDEEGRYALRIPETRGPQVAIISAQLAGHFERNLNRQGDGISSAEALSAEDLQLWNVAPHQVCLPGQPREIPFVMLPAARAAGTLVDEDGRPLRDYSVSLTGKELPPGSEVLAQVTTDEMGRFELTNIPTTARFQFVVRKPRAQLKPPWDDSWASGPLQFRHPGTHDLSFQTTETRGTSEVKVKRFTLRLVGAGVHDQLAVQRAARQDVYRTAAEDHPAEIEVVTDEMTLQLDNAMNPSTDATSVSGVVVDEEGTPIPHCDVAYPGSVVVNTDDRGNFSYEGGPADRFVLRVYHPDYRIWHASVQRGDVVRVVLLQKLDVQPREGTRTMTVRVIDSRTGDPVPDVQVTATRWEGPRDKEVAGTIATDSQGNAVFEGLEFIQHELRLSADQPLPYVGTSAYPSGDQKEVVMLVDRACQLMLRAVDSETGVGIAGVHFGRERAAGELWMQAIENDILGSEHADLEETTDADGYMRRQVSSAKWSYMVSRYPDGYASILPIGGRQELELDTPIGGRTEYTFRLVKSNGR